MAPLLSVCWTPQTKFFNFFIGGRVKTLHRSMLTGLDTPSFNHQFDRGENESILIGLRTALGVRLLGVGTLGLN